VIGSQYWVVLVICQYPGGPGKAVTSELAKYRIDSQLASGELLCLPDGSVAEARSRHADEASAHAERDRLISRGASRGRIDYRVVLTSSLAEIVQS
jgi:hypothetical protein